jgi:hypothetical protein
MPTAATTTISLAIWCACMPKDAGRNWLTCVRPRNLRRDFFPAPSIFRVFRVTAEKAGPPVCLDNFLLDVGDAPSP